MIILSMLSHLKSFFFFLLSLSPSLPSPSLKGAK